MTVSLIKGSTSQGISGVIGINILEGDKPTIQVIHKTGDAIHCDLYQSEDYTAVSVQIHIPTGE